MKSLSYAIIAAFNAAAALAANPTSIEPELRGIMATSSTQRFSLLIPGTSRSEWVSIGETFAGWNLISYDASNGILVLRRENGAELGLFLAASHVESSANDSIKSRWAGTFALSKGGTIAFDGHLVQVGQIQSIIVKMLDQAPDLPILIRIDRGSRLGKFSFLLDDTNEHGTLQFLLDSFRKAGFKKLFLQAY